MNKNQNKPTDITEKHKYDISNLSVKELIHYCAELVIEVKRLRAGIEAHDSESKTFYDNYQASKKEASRIEDQIDIIGKAISQTYTKFANDGHLKSKTLEEKTNLIIQDILSERKRNAEMFIEYEEKLKRNKIALDEMRAHYLQTVKQQNETPQANTSGTYDNGDFKNFAGMHTDVKTAEKIVSQIDTGDYLSTMRTFDKKELMDSLDDNAKEIIRIVGEEGLSEYTEISARAQECNVPASRIERLMQDLTDNKMILAVDKVQTMQKTGSGRRVYALTNDIGKNLYKSIFGKNCILSEKETIVKDNDNLEHAYSIKDVAKVLTERGMTNVTYDRAKNTIKIADNKMWIPDVICYDLSGKIQYYEVEMVTTNQADFDNKLDKANYKARALNIVVPSTAKSIQCQSKVNAWLAKKNKSQVNLDIYIYTFQQLKNKEEGTHISSKLEILSKKVESAETKAPVVKEPQIQKKSSEDTKQNPPTITEEIVKDGD